MKDGHERFRELLALAAADALDGGEQRALERHLAECAACAAEFEEWRALSAGLKRLPTPRAPAALVERTHAQIQRKLAARNEDRSRRRVLALLVLFAWAMTIASWPIVRLLSGGVAQVLELGSAPAWMDMIGYATLTWLTAGVAALTLGIARRRERRWA
jgi:anti-sigma factor RsiW